MSTADADAQALAIPLQTALKTVGVTMNIKALSAARYQADLGKHTMQSWIESNLGLLRRRPLLPTYLWYGTKSVLNWFQFSIPSVDAVMKQFATVLTPAKKNALALKVQQPLNGTSRWISLGEPELRDGDALRHRGLPLRARRPPDLSRPLTRYSGDRDGRA